MRQKVSHKLITIILSQHNRFTKLFHWKIFWYTCTKVVLLKIASLLAYVATLPCETLTLENKQYTTKLQDSVAIHI